MRVVIHIDPAKLPQHTPEQLREWLCFKLGAGASMDANSPLEDCDLEQCVAAVEA